MDIWKQSYLQLNMFILESKHELYFIITVNLIITTVAKQGGGGSQPPPPEFWKGGSTPPDFEIIFFKLLK